MDFHHLLLEIVRYIGEEPPTEYTAWWNQAPWVYLDNPLLWDTPTDWALLAPAATPIGLGVELGRCANGLAHTSFLALVRELLQWAGLRLFYIDLQRGEWSPTTHTIPYALGQGLRAILDIWLYG
jgi:hypothetical protein